jgi:hypothetical protein
MRTEEETRKSDQVEPVITLLEKAEQILSIINLPDNAIKKYNQLKELTFEKLGREFKPLVKIGKNEKIGGEVGNFEVLNKYRAVNFKKGILIEFLLDLLEKFKFENFDCVKQFEKVCDKIHKSKEHLNPIDKKNLEDCEFDLKMEDIKIKDYLGKTEIYSRRNYKESFFSDDEIFLNFERNIEELRFNHENEIKEYQRRFNELRNKYNPDLEREFFSLRREFEEKEFTVRNINEAVTPLFEKYYTKNSNWYQNENPEKPNQDLEKINFVVSLTNKFFNDNKYLVDLVSSLQNEKNALLEERNFPFVENCIVRNNLLTEIADDYKEIEKDSKRFHKKFREVIEYIEKNFENI